MLFYVLLLTRSLLFAALINVRMESVVYASTPLDDFMKGEYFTLAFSFYSLLTFI